MRYAILAARLHGSPVFEAVPQTGKPDTMNELFKKLIQEPGDIAELHLIVSDQGVTKRKKFPLPAKQPAATSSESAAHETPTPVTAPVVTGVESVAAPEPVVEVPVEPAAEEAGAAPELSGETLAEADESPVPPAGEQTGSKRKR